MKYCDTSKLSIRQIDKPTAKKMVVKHHYSQLWTKCSVALGIFHTTGNEHAFFDEPEEKLIGVCIFGDPVGRGAGESISSFVDRTEVYELTRLFIHDGYGNWSFKFSKNDRWKHGRTIFPYYGTNDIGKIQRQVKEPFWIRKEPRKHRYIYLLTSKKDKKNIIKNLKYPILDYPRMEEFGELEIKKIEPILGR